jgi:hypothetical protein
MVGREVAKFLVVKSALVPIPFGAFFRSWSTVSLLMNSRMAASFSDLDVSP